MHTLDDPHQKKVAATSWTEGLGSARKGTKEYAMHGNSTVGKEESTLVEGSRAADLFSD